MAVIKTSAGAKILNVCVNWIWQDEETDRRLQ
jgi:hypothetical protein